MVGLGENKEEVIQVMDDLRAAEVVLLQSVNTYNHLKASSTKSLLPPR